VLKKEAKPLAARPSVSAYAGLRRLIRPNGPALRMASSTRNGIVPETDDRLVERPTTSIDVFIPSYQYGRFLRDSAMSVLTQQVPNLRLLIIDNASTDGSQEIAKEIAAADSRVTLFLNDHNRGFHDSFNRAVDWASADYLVLICADDVLAAGALARGAAFLDEHPEVAFLYGVEGRLNDGLLDPGRCDAATTRWNIVKGTDFIRRTCWDSFCDIGEPAVMRRTAAQKKAGHFRQSLRTCDFEMYLRLAMVGDVARTNRVLGIRRMHESRMSTPYVERRVEDFKDHEAAFVSFFAHEGSALPDAKDLQAMSRRKIGDYAYWYAMWQLIHCRADAREAFNFAAERRPTQRWTPPLTFLFKKRWLRSLWRAGRRVIHKPTPLSPSFSVPKYL
jgi:glycosyltransferase involved in cell wall biosynthesis